MVINGPVAKAGSIFILSKVMGTNVPNILANITTANRLKDTEAVIPVSQHEEVVNEHDQTDNAGID